MACHDLPDMRHEKLLPTVTDAQMLKYLLYCNFKRSDSIIKSLQRVIV